MTRPLNALFAIIAASILSLSPALSKGLPIAPEDIDLRAVGRGGLKLKTVGPSEA